MTLHFGRLFDHVHIVVSDLEKSRAFYRALLAAIGRTLNNDDVDDFGSDELFVSASANPDEISKIHLAFQVQDRAMVDHFYEAAMAAGGVCNGPPGERSYHPGYYAAFVRDPDGNNLEAVFHGAAHRSAASVLVDPI